MQQKQLNSASTGSEIPIKCKVIEKFISFGIIGIAVIQETVDVRPEQSSEGQLININEERVTKG